MTVLGSNRMPKSLSSVGQDLYGENWYNHIRVIRRGFGGLLTGLQRMPSLHPWSQKCHNYMYTLTILGQVDCRKCFASKMSFMWIVIFLKVVIIQIQKKDHQIIWLSFVYFLSLIELRYLFQICQYNTLMTCHSSAFIT